MRATQCLKRHARLGGKCASLAVAGILLGLTFGVDPASALDKTFEGLEPNAQGKLIFAFTPTRNYAEINAIEVMDEAWRRRSEPHTQGYLQR